MTMSGYKKRSVGIKELKDRASEIIAIVQRTGQAVSITKNNQEVAKIIPIPRSPHERLIAAGLLRPGDQPPPLAGLKLEGPATDASSAIQAILEDRNQD
jgi:prevent-host-death family protein